MNKNERLLELDVFRGIAAFSVMMFHFTDAYDNGIGHLDEVPSFALGYYRLQLFLIVSGFVTFLLLERTKTISDFIVSRVSRLLPTYIASITIIMLYVSFFTFRDVETPSLTDYFANFTMMAPWLGSPYLDEAHWTLSLEIIFYSIIFTIFIIFKGSFVRNIDKICIGWLLYQITIQTLVINDVPINSVLITHTLSNYSHLFIIGIIFRKMYISGQTWQRYGIIGLCLMAQYFIFDLHYNDINLVGHAGMIHHGFDAPVIAILVGLFALFINGKTSLITIKPLVFLGTISYGLFLIHFAIGTEVMYTLQHFYGVHSIASIGIAVLLSFCFAILLTFYVEQPAMTFIRNQYKKLRKTKGWGILPSFSYVQK